MRKIHQNINIANTLKGEFYNSYDIFLDSIEKIFANNWVLITDINNISNQKNAFPFMYMDKLLPEPLLLIKINLVIFMIQSVSWIAFLMLPHYLGSFSPTISNRLTI